MYRPPERVTADQPRSTTTRRDKIARARPAVPAGLTHTIGKLTDVGAVIQRATITVFVSGLGMKTQQVTVETGDDGTIQGQALHDTLLAKALEQIPALASEGKKQFVYFLYLGKQLGPDQSYGLKGEENFTLGFSASRYEAAKLANADEDAELIALARRSDACIVGCYLFSRPGNEAALAEQQALHEVVAAIPKGKFTLVLVDPGFAQGDAGQIVDYLATKMQILPDEKTRSGNDDQSFKFKGVEIFYVARKMNPKTEAVLRKEGKVKWYSD
jgi:hypothetical protein